MSDRVRFYQYKVTCVHLDLPGYTDMVSACGMPHLRVYTTLVKAKNAAKAKAHIRALTPSRPIAFLSSGRYPKRLGTSVSGSQPVALTPRQLKTLEREVHGSAKLPHALETSVFAASNPNSTLYTRLFYPPASSPLWSPVDAWARGESALMRSGDTPSTVVKSTPIHLSDNPIDIGGFTVGFKKPGETPVPLTVTQPTPQFDIYEGMPVIEPWLQPETLSSSPASFTLLKTLVYIGVLGLITVGVIKCGQP